MRVLHFTKDDGEGEYVVFVEDDDESAEPDLYDPDNYLEDGWGLLAVTKINGDGLAVSLGQPYFLEKQT